jgi:hypothetical protein
VAEAEWEADTGEVVLEAAAAAAEDATGGE